MDIEHDVYNFLFSYTMDNTLKSGQHGWLTGAQRQEWIHQVTGVDPGSKSRKAFERNMIKQTPPQKPISSTEAFDEVLKMMNDTPSDNTAKLEALRKELSKVKAKLATAEEDNVLSAKQTKLAQAALAKAEAHNRTMRTDRDSFKKLADEYTQRYRTAHTDRKASYRQRKEEMNNLEQEEEKMRALTRANKMLGQALKEKDQELRAIRIEAGTAKEQVLRIWTMMKTAKEMEGRKRKTCGDADELGPKKARSEH